LRVARVVHVSRVSKWGRRDEAGYRLCCSTKDVWTDVSIVVVMTARCWNVLLT
jgi:hypothetical protein